MCGRIGWERAHLSATTAVVVAVAAAASAPLPIYVDIFRGINNIEQIATL